MLKSDAGYTIQPIISVGDTLRNGYRFAAIPDGIGLGEKEDGVVEVFVAHETSLVPFPPVSATSTGQSDFENAQVSKLEIDKNTLRVLKGEFEIDSSANYQRFCSAFMADKEQGFNHPIFFANEEATDYISPPPLLAWPPDPNNKRQAGRIHRSPARCSSSERAASYFS